jgi:hypothetical protein
MSKQTAVEWLAEQLKSKYDIDIERLSVTDKAKEMEKQQQSRAWHNGLENWGNEWSFEQYYFETFKD